MTPDREPLNEADAGSSLPIADIDGSDVEAAAESVKGGATQSTGKVTTHDLVITKHADSSSPS